MGSPSFLKILLGPTSVIFSSSLGRMFPDRSPYKYHVSDRRAWQGPPKNLRSGQSYLTNVENNEKGKEISFERKNIWNWNWNIRIMNTKKNIERNCNNNVMNLQQQHKYVYNIIKKKK